MKQRLEAFDCINKQRLILLELLDERKLSNGELSRFSGLRLANTIYHLEVLDEAGLIERSLEQKRNVYRLAKRKTRGIYRWYLTQPGQEALKYFPESRKGRALL